MNPDTWVQLGAGTATTVAAAFVGRAARRSRRQETRDDFTAVTDRMSGEITRQGQRITELEATAGAQNRRLEGAGVAITYLIGRVRELHGYIRSVGMEPPTAGPIPEKAREFIHHDL